jgi:MFS transporter, DHA2 family, multidrug resistance protein
LDEPGISSLASVEEHETASAAGLMNFLRTLAGAVATSFVNTARENGTQVKHADPAGLVDSSGETMRALAAALCTALAS